jgi:hypothetical protein
MAQSPHWEGLRMRLLIELPLTIALFTLAVKAGWPYTLVFVLGYILAPGVQVTSRFLIVLAIFLTFVLTALAVSDRFLFSRPASFLTAYHQGGHYDHSTSA